MTAARPARLITISRSTQVGGAFFEGDDQRAMRAREAGGAGDLPLGFERLSRFAVKAQWNSVPQ
jgi:hypothetical protein